MCYPVCVMVHIKEPLLLIGKCSILSLCCFCWGVLVLVFCLFFYYYYYYYYYGKSQIVQFPSLSGFSLAVSHISQIHVDGPHQSSNTKHLPDIFITVSIP